MRARKLFVSLLVTAGGVFMSAQAQVQQAWVARYNNGITNGQHRALKMKLGTDGNIYVCGYSQNASSNLDYAVLKYSPSGGLAWAARYGSTNTSQAVPSGFVLDSGNNAVITGSEGTVKYDSQGQVLWTSPLSGTSVAAQGDNVFVTGIMSSFDTVKISPSGSNVWTASFARVGQLLPNLILVDTSSNVLVVGPAIYRETPGNGGYMVSESLLVIKYSSAGAQLWQYQDTSGIGLLSNGVRVSDAALDAFGNLVIFFDFGDEFQFVLDKISTAGFLEWRLGNPTGAVSESEALALGSDDRICETGADANYPGTAYGTYGISSNGVCLWTNVFGVQNATSVPYAIASDLTGSVYVTGYSPGATSSNDIVTIAYDTNGKQLWVERYDGPGHGDDEGNAIAADAHGNVYVAGYDTPVGGGTEMVLIKYSSVTAKHEANGSFQLEAQGAANEPFDVRASTNLADWLDLGTYGADTNGVLLFTDTNAGLFPQRFYVAKPE